MTRTDILFYLLLGHLLLVCVCSSCAPAKCTKCSIPAECCQQHLNESNQCTKNFTVSINSTGSKVKEGDDITLTCVHTLPPLNLTFAWRKDEEKMDNENNSELHLKKVLSVNAGQYVCLVSGTCGSCKSPPEEVTVENETLVILVICGVSALVLVVALGLAMKFKLNRDNAKHKERMRQRAQAQQSGGPPPFTPRGS